MIVGLIALSWDGLETRKDMLSAHPLHYLAGAFSLMVFFSTHRVFKMKTFKLPYGRGVCGTNRRRNQPALAGHVADAFLSLFFLVVLAVPGLGWIVFVVPMNYFIILISGTLARQQLKGGFYQPVMITEGNRLVLSRYKSSEQLPPNAVNISLTGKPFAITQFLTSMSIFLLSAVFL